MNEQINGASEGESALDGFLSVNCEKTKQMPVRNTSVCIRYFFHMFLMIGMMLGIAWFSNKIILGQEWFERRYILFWSVVLTAIALYSWLERKKLYDNRKTLVILTLCFLFSGLLLLLSDSYIKLPIWIIGGILAAALADRQIGMLYLYYFIYHAVYLQESPVHGLLFHFAVATILCLVIPKMNRFLSMFYIMIFTSCMIITCSIINQGFRISKMAAWDTFFILCTYLSCIFLAMLLKKCFFPTETILKEVIEETEKVGQVIIKTEETLVKERMEEKKMEESIDYIPYCDEKSELLIALRNKHKAIYAQSVLVGKLAAEIAVEMNLNAELTKAAGLYKRIGKIMEDATAETTREIAESYEFPEELVLLLDQLNHDIIARKEGAVLLLTDEIISCYSVTRHGQKNDAPVPVEKIVDAVVSKKIFTGDMNASELTMSECVTLRNRLVALLKEQDKRRISKIQKGKPEQ